MTKSNISLDPNRLTVEQAVRVLAAAGGRTVTSDLVNEDLARGAPKNPDGTLNLVHYASWLVKEMGRHAD
ncbi:MAG: hypothetical protein RIC55_02440 [Pirellulaceae bacterium]